MAVLYRKTNISKFIIRKAQTGLKLENIEGTQGIQEKIDPIKKRKAYRTDASVAAPYLANWLQDPVTIDKMNEQFGEGVSGKMLKNINKVHLFDMRALAGLSENKFNDKVAYYNKKRGLSPNSARYKTNKSDLGWMRQQGQRYNPTTGTGVQGVRIPRLNGIGTIYNTNNPDPFGTATHELTHATKYQNLAEKYISDKWGNRQIPMKNLNTLGFDESEEQLGYLRDIGVNESGESGEGVYPRIMQLRKMLNLVPGQQVTPEMLKGIKFENKKSPLRGLRANWNDDTIIEIMNTVAENRANTNPYTITT